MPNAMRTRRQTIGMGLGGAVIAASGRWTFAADSDAAVREKLSLVLDVDYQNVPLGGVLGAIGKAVRVPIEPDWEALKADGIVAVDEVRIKLRRVSVATVVRLIVAQAESAPGKASCVIGDGKLRIVAGGAADLVADADPKSRVNVAAVRALDRPVMIGFDDTLLSEALDRFRMITRQGVFVCWRQVTAAGASPKAKVTVPKARTTVREAIANTFAAASPDKAVKIDITVEDGIIVIRAARD